MLHVFDTKLDFVFFGPLLLVICAVRKTVRKSVDACLLAHEYLHNIIVFSHEAQVVFVWYNSKGCAHVCHENCVHKYFSIRLLVFLLPLFVFSVSCRQAGCATFCCFGIRSHTRRQCSACAVTRVRFVVACNTGIHVIFILAYWVPAQHRRVFAWSAGSVCLV